jgi:small subunit ribosomal protein S8
MFTSIKNGQLAKRDFIYHTRKKICESFLKILWDEGFIVGYKISSENPKELKIFLKYNKNRPVINSIQFISKPGRRIYYSINQV